MLWLLIPVVILSAFFVLGLLLNLLVRLTPGIQRKVKLARLIVETCCPDEDRAFYVAQDLEWRLRARYGDEKVRGVYAALLKRAGGK